MYGCPMWIAPQTQQTGNQHMGGIQFNSIDEMKKFIKAMKPKEDKKKTEEKKDDDNFIIIKKPKPPKYSLGQMMMFFAVTFPIVGPVYYFVVLGSWELLRAGMAAVLVR